MTTINIIITCVLIYHIIGACLGFYIHRKNPIESYGDFLVQRMRYPGMKTYTMYCAVSFTIMSVIWLPLLAYEFFKNGKKK